MPMKQLQRNSRCENSKVPKSFSNKKMCCIHPERDKLKLMKESYGRANKGGRIHSET